MTTNPTTTAPAHEPAPVILQLELAMSAEALAAIRRLSSVVQQSGVMEAAQAVYEVALPEWRSVTDTLDDATYSVVVERMGWSELHDWVAELSAALMMAIGIHEIDVMLPAWITREDRDKRDADSLKELVRLFPEVLTEA